MAAAAELTRDLFDALHRRDVAAASALIDEKAVWRFPGRRGALAGDHVGREAIFAFFMKVASLTDGSFRTERIEIVGDGDVAFFHFIGRAQRGEKTLANDTCLRLHFSEGRLIAAQEWIWDLGHVEDFWG